MDFLFLQSLVFFPSCAICISVPLFRAIHGVVDGKPVEMNLWRWWIFYFVGWFALATATLTTVIAVTVWSELPATSGIQLRSTCKVLSKGVDLRSSKCCPNDYSPNAINTADSAPCHFEYYWACIFKVEFWPTSSFLPLQATAESPHKLLPSKCRPGFRAVWKAVEEYEVNSSYPCTYNPINLRKVYIMNKLPSNCNGSNTDQIFFPLHLWQELTSSNRAITSASSNYGKLYRSLLVGAIKGVLFSIFSFYIVRLAYKWKQGVAKEVHLWNARHTLFQLKWQFTLLSSQLMYTLVLALIQDEFLLSTAETWIMERIIHAVGLHMDVRREL